MRQRKGKPLFFFSFCDYIVRHGIELFVFVLLLLCLFFGLSCFGPIKPETSSPEKCVCICGLCVCMCVCIGNVIDVNGRIHFAQNVHGEEYTTISHVIPHWLISFSVFIFSLHCHRLSQLCSVQIFIGSIAARMHSSIGQ